MSKQPSLPIRCALLFRWPYNPYLELLAGALRERGLSVQVPDRNVFFVRELCRLGLPHVVHLQEIAPFFLGKNLLRTVVKTCFSLAQLYYLKLRGTRIVWTAHDLKTHWERYGSIERLFTVIVAGLADAIVTHCAVAKKAIIDRFLILRRNKIYVIPHGNYINAYRNRVDSKEARSALGLPSDAVVLLCFGLIRPYKGLDTLIDALHGAPPQLHLIIAGKPFDERTSRRLRERIAGQPNITFVPQFVPADEVQTFMNACDVVVFAYREILTSGAILLAMSFGKPCVAPRKGCIPEILDEAGAFLFDGDSSIDLRSAFNQIIDHRNLLSEMGAHNFEKASRWSWDLVASATVEIYRSVLPQRSIVFGAKHGSMENK